MRKHASDPLLFAPPPAHNGTRTSCAAAADATAKAPTCRSLILGYLTSIGCAGSNCDGATHEEIAAATGIRLDTVKARVHELGCTADVRALKQTRCTSTGSQALVFVAAVHVGVRQVEPWPLPRTDWRQIAIDQERRAIDAERRVQELEQRLAARKESA